jgi:hypothetical protein
MLLVNGNGPLPAGAKRHIAMALLLAASMLLGACSVVVSDSALSKGATSYWLWTDTEAQQSVFATTTPQVTLHVKFNYNVIVSTQLFRATWYAPGGQPYVGGGVKTIYGSNDTLIVNLKIAGTTAEQKPGRWRVKLHYGAEELVNREFELVAS